MAQAVWMTGLVVAGAAMYLASGRDFGVEHGEVDAVVDAFPQAVQSVSGEVGLGSSGSALATAAFGLSALQPETFNSQIVLDIIEASPLAYGEKDRLTAKLMAAKAGHAELPSVLADIRVSLAVE